VITSLFVDVGLAYGVTNAVMITEDGTNNVDIGMFEMRMQAVIAPACTGILIMTTRGYSGMRIGYFQGESDYGNAMSLCPVPEVMVLNPILKTEEDLGGTNENAWMYRLINESRYGLPVFTNIVVGAGVDDLVTGALMIAGNGTNEGWQVSYESRSVTFYATNWMDGLQGGQTNQLVLLTSGYQGAKEGEVVAYTDYGNAVTTNTLPVPEPAVLLAMALMVMVWRSIYRGARTA